MHCFVSSDSIKMHVTAPTLHLILSGLGWTMTHVFAADAPSSESWPFAAFECR